MKNPAADSGFWDNHRAHVGRLVDAVKARRRRGQLQLDWGWTQIGVTFVPWCPSCGVVCAIGAGQLAHEQNVHEVGQEAILVDEIDDDEIPEAIEGG